MHVKAPGRMRKRHGEARTVETFPRRDEQFAELDARSPFRRGGGSKDSKGGGDGAVCA